MTTSLYTLENNIIKSNCTSSEERYVGGLGYFCFNAMKKHGDKLAQINMTTGEEETYDTLIKKCIRAAIALQKTGVEKGDIITIYSKTNLNSYVTVIACFFIGAIPLYLDANISLFGIIDSIRNIQPKLFLVTPEFIETIQDALKNANSDTDVITFNDDFFKPVKEENEFRPVYTNNLEETAIIHMSSGSTGLPKGICLKHHSVAYCQMFSADLWVENEPKVMLSLDGPYWSLETLLLICCIEEGVCRLIGSEYEHKNIWYHLEKYKVNVAYLIPWVLVGMVDRGMPNDINLKNLKTIFVEGSLLPSKYRESFEQLLPNVDFFPSYGLTETSGLTGFRKTDIHREYSRTKPRCIGVPDFGVYLKVADISNGKALGPNMHGELRVKTKAIMNGYCNLDSSDEFDEEGWFQTGDIVYYDEDFCFFLVDRIKELIRFQGWSLSPSLVEAKLLSHPAVKLAVVFGIPNEVDEEHPMGLVVLHDSSATVTPKEIEAYIEERVPDTYRLRGGVKIVDGSYLKTGNKIQRYKLKQLVLSGDI